MVLPPDLMQRLRDLKLWQESHEHLLKKREDGSNLSDYQTIQGLSAFDLNAESPEPLDWESKPITPVKSFEQLVEQKLAEDPGPGSDKNGVKPKRPFLRKGSGLSRFRLTETNTSQCRSRSARKKPQQKRSEKIVENFTPLKVPETIFEPKAVWCEVRDDEQLDNCTIQSSTPIPGEQTLFEQAVEKELLLFEALEQRAQNSSFDSANSSILRLFPPKITSTNAVQNLPATIPEKKVHWEEDQPQEDVRVQENIIELLARLHNLKKSNENQIQNVPPNPQEPQRNLRDEEVWSSQLSSLNTSISSSDLDSTCVDSTVETRDVAIGTDDTTIQEDQSATELKKKVEEYNRKIKLVTDENQRIGELKKELQAKKDGMEKELKRKQKEMEEQQRVFIMEIEAEKKKLVKEKSIFQTYIKDSQNKPNKKEREEISNLKQEVADLRETLKLKEAKNGTTQARLRTQIKQLEKENDNLKDEVEKLTRENAKLAASQKLNRRPSETKMLHEINKNITKLTQETLKRSNSTSGSGRHHEEAEKSSKKLGSDGNRERRGSKTEGFDKLGDGQEKRKARERDDSLDMTTFRNVSQLNIEKQYENIFKGDFRQNTTLNDSKKNEKTERILEDGSKEVRYSNGTCKTTSSDGNLITVKYVSGDMKLTSLTDGTVKYFFFETNVWQTTEADGTDIFEFPNGSKEKRFKDGRHVVEKPNGFSHVTFPDGTQEVNYPDGSKLEVKSNGDSILHLPNGQREIETKEHKRREYPDGTVKILYPDGTQETRYSNGRIRIKNPEGVLVLDTHHRGGYQ